MSFASSRVLCLAISCAILLTGSFALLAPRKARSASSTIVISQVYGGGGNSGAPYQNDYLELYNRGTAAVCVNGWSVQYAGATSGSWSKFDLPNVSIPANGYLLIAAAGGAIGSALPTPNATSTLSLSATAGKIALVSNTSALSCGTALNNCFPNANIVDFVGYGTANNYETTAVSALSNTTAAIRKMNGATETDNNSTDFTVAVPAPRSSYPALATCVVPTPPSGTGLANLATVVQGTSTLLTVTVTPGANPTSTGLTVSADLSSIGGSPNQQFFDNGTNGDAVAGDNIFSYQAALPAATATGAKSLPVTITDAQARSGTTNIALTVIAPLAPGNVVISQIFGGGGNSGAPYTHDYVELFNRSMAAVDLTGWSIQYASASGTSWTKVDLSGALQPGQYLLVQLDSGGANGVPLPLADITGTLILASTAGKIALLNNNTSITSGTACPIAAGTTGLIDFVGYGSSATCFEGSAPTAAPSSTNAIFRINNGCPDTNQNGADFLVMAPAPRNRTTPFTLCFATPITATGAANPATIVAGNTTLLTVSVTPGATPTSTGVSVTANLTGIGGASNQQFFDNGTNGDAVAGDGIYSFSATVPANTSAGALSLPVNVSDAQGRTTTTNLALTVNAPPTPITATGAANPAIVAAGNPTLLTVTVTPGANPTSSGVTVSVNGASLGLPAITLVDNGTNGDAVANDGTYSQLITVPTSTTSGAYALPVTVSDAQSRTATTSIPLQVTSAVPPGTVVISQVYGGGGNSGAPYSNDFIELYNRGAQPVNLAGWTLLYASATGGTWQSITLTGSLQPGQYLLIQLDSGGSNGVALPAPDLVGAFGLAATAGKVVLLTHGFPIPSGTLCPLTGSVSGVMDFVGYGSSANCFEGTAPAPAPSGTLALVRVGNGCQDTQQNTHDWFTIVPRPRNTTTSLNDCTAGARFNNSTIAFAALPSCAGPGVIATLTTQITNTGTRAQADNPGDELTVAPNILLPTVPASCTASGGTCAISSDGTIRWNGSIGVGQTVTIRWQAQISDAAIFNAQLCAAGTLSYDSNNDEQNEAQLSLSGCRVIDCPTVGPGAAFPFNSESSAQKAGSLLVFPLHSSNATNPARENTRLNLTNTHPTRNIAVHLFFIEDDSANVADSYLCLTPNQTASFTSADVDPNVQGFLIALAVDEQFGCPINFNYLLGDEYVKLASGHAANLNAEALAALVGDPLLCDAQTGEAEVKLDGKHYNAAPRVLALDNIPSPADGNQTLLVLDRLNGSLITGIGTVGQIFGLLFDDQENPFSFEFTAGRRQFRVLLDNTFPRTAPRLPTLIPAGRSGWLKLWRSGDNAIIGAALNFNSQSANKNSAFNQGHNLHKLTLSDEASLVVPVFPPHC